MAAAKALRPLFAYNRAMEREVRYCTTEDGVSIAYSVAGEGPTLLILQSGVESLSLTPGSPWQDFRDRLAAGRQVIEYDMRGTGLSQHSVSDLSHSALVLDVEAVVAVAGAKRLSIFSSGLSGPRARE